MFDILIIEKTINSIVLGAGAPADPAVLAKQITDAVTAQVQPVLNQLTTMQASMTADEGVEATLVQRVTDLETALTDTVNHLAAGNTTAATSTATAALPTNDGTTGQSTSGATSAGVPSSAGNTAAGQANANGDTAGAQTDPNAGTAGAADSASSTTSGSDAAAASSGNTGA